MCDTDQNEEFVSLPNDYATALMTLVDFDQLNISADEYIALAIRAYNGPKNKLPKAMNYNEKHVLMPKSLVNMANGVFDDIFDICDACEGSEEQYNTRGIYDNDNVNDLCNDLHDALVTVAHWR